MQSAEQNDLDFSALKAKCAHLDGVIISMAREASLYKDRIGKLEKEKRYWMEASVDYAKELSGFETDSETRLQINGVELDTLESSVRDGYQTSAATQLDMIALLRRVLTPNNK